MSSPKRRINPSDVNSISYDFRTSKMQIRNHKDLLIHEETTSESKFNKSVSKLLSIRSR